MRWTQEAEEAISKVPFFVRKRVRRRVEEEAARQGAPQVTMAHVRACQRRFLERMDEEVKGHQVESCFGPAGCPNRAVPRNDVASMLEVLLGGKHLREFLSQRVGGPLKLHHELRVSISDCPNACSRPQIADVGLIGCRRPRVSHEPCQGCEACVQACGEDAIQIISGKPVLDKGRCLGCGQCIGVCPTGSLEEEVRGYRVLLGGKLGRHPRLATELPGVHPAEELPRIVDRLVDVYMKRCIAGERLGEIIERMGWEEFLEELEGGRKELGVQGLAARLSSQGK
jgi:anaerobic sulfite reductase subunit C